MGTVSSSLRPRTNLLVLAMCMGFLAAGGVAPAAAVDEGDVAPDFSLVDLETGATFSLSEFEGSVIVLNFWAFW